MECNEHKTFGMPGYFKNITTKKQKNTLRKVNWKKDSNPILKKMTVHKEIK